MTTPPYGELARRLKFQRTRGPSNRCPLAVADLDLQMGGGGWGGRSPGPEVKTGGARSQKKNFSALQASVWSKNKRGTRAPWAPPLDPSLFGSTSFLSTLSQTPSNIFILFCFIVTLSETRP